MLYNNIAFICVFVNYFFFGSGEYTIRNIQGAGLIPALMPVFIANCYPE